MRVVIRKRFSRLLRIRAPRLPSTRMEPRRIEVALRGGLGNQLFLFAAGLEVSRRLNLALHLWTKPLSDDGVTPRKFELSNVVEGIATWGDESTVRLPFREAGFAYDPGFEEIVEPCRLEGYFQSPKYFRESRHDVIALIRKAPDFQEANLDSVDDHIAVQLRRGDYLEPAQAKFHGVVPVSFFRNAVQQLRDRLGNLPVQVFSDDQSLAVSFATSIVDAKVHVPSAEESPLYILGLLSRAKGLAISNSSFGWWGAFLSGEGSQVIAPSPWFRDPNVNTSDLLEPAWSVLQIS